MESTRQCVEWKQLSRSLYVFEDSCNVYAVVSGNSIVVVNAGTGQWLDAMDQLPGTVRNVMCTHFFRDHIAGALPAADRGIEVYAPYWEKELIEDAEGHFQRRETYLIYDNIWDLFGPIRNIPVAHWLQDWEQVNVCGLEFAAIPTPGITTGAISLMCTIDGKSVAFCGEAIHSPGKIARIAPLQYNYNDLPGALTLRDSIKTLRKAKPDVLAPSIGMPMTDDADSALAELQENLAFVLSERSDHKERVEESDQDPLVKVSDHIYKSRFSVASSWFILSDSGKVLAIDYGYHGLVSFSSWSNHPRYRRPILHGLDGLKDRFGVDRIDVVLLTHFHDDHVAGIPLLQRLHGTECWAGENFAGLLSNPEDHRFPCDWPEAIDIRGLALDSPIEWEEYSFVLHPMSGHTRWSTLIEFEADGKKVIATGDQYFTMENKEPGESPFMQNHVYRNGASLESIRESNQLVAQIRPDLVLPGHGDSYEVDDKFYRTFENYDAVYRELHERILPLVGDHFGIDSRAAWLTPYRSRIDKAAPLTYRAVVRNPSPETAQIAARLVGPPGWTSESVVVTAAGRSEAKVTCSITPPASFVGRRQAITLDMTVNGRPYGQVAEAIVTIGHRLY